MRPPGSVAVDVALAVAPALAWVRSDEATRASVVPPVGEAATKRIVVPLAGTTVPSALTAAKSTIRAPGTVVLTDGAVMAVPAALVTVAAWARTGWAVSTPA